MIMVFFWGVCNYLKLNFLLNYLNINLLIFGCYNFNKGMCFGLKVG